MSLTIEYLGHSGFVLSDGSHTLVVDPYLTGNPRAGRAPESVECDYIALTHGHADHVGDTVKIAAQTGAPVIAVYELCDWLSKQGVQSLERANTGGRITTSFGWVAFTQALHSSSYQGVYTGNPCGLVISMGEVIFYHAGDTEIFGDMKLIGEMYRPSIAAIPIGDRFTMGARVASRAADLIDATFVIPVHYATFDLLAPNTDGFAPLRSKVREMQPGESWTVEGGPPSRRRF
jgi:L-ascorbate metabolism protein UlaG (beta-lactamase superfamily)